MKTFSIGALIAAAAALGLSILCTFTLDNALSWTDRVNLIFDPASAESFDAYYFAFGTLPRFAAAAIGGALLGLVGSLLQQLTQNPMTSPLTLGTSSGGWLAVVLISAFFPAAAGAWLSLGAFAGALAAFGLILLIAGPRGMTGVALIIAGMVVNLLFGAIATAVVLLRAQFVENVFLWGAGDLAQNGWGGITALLPQTVPVVIDFCAARTRTHFARRRRCSGSRLAYRARLRCVGGSGHLALIGLYCSGRRHQFHGTHCTQYREKSWVRQSAHSALCKHADWGGTPLRHRRSGSGTHLAYRQHRAHRRRVSHYRNTDLHLDCPEKPLCACARRCAARSGIRHGAVVA